MACLQDFARREGLSAGQITGIGAFREAVISYFDWETKDYLEIPVEEQVEVASLLGDIGVDEQGAPALHIHLVLGRRDGGAHRRILTQSFGMELRVAPRQIEAVRLGQGGVGQGAEKDALGPGRPQGGDRRPADARAAPRHHRHFARERRHVGPRLPLSREPPTATVVSKRPAGTEPPAHRRPGGTT